MERLFGMPIGSVMVVLVVIFLFGAVIVGYQAWRNPVLFKMAVRNVPRRRAQSILIVVGLMLATLLFSASFSTGDTLANSIRVEVLKRGGLVDEMVRSDTFDASGRRSLFDYAVYEQIRDALSGAPVDGVMPVVTYNAPAISPKTNLSEPSVELVGLDAGLLAGFDELEDVETGERLDVSSLGDRDVYLSQEAADNMDVSTGDTIRVFVAQRPLVMTIAGIYGIGGNESDPSSAFVRIDVLQDVLETDGKINRVYISNDGGLVDGAKHTDAVIAIVEPVLEGSGIEVAPVKQDNLAAADTAGSAFASVFLLFGNFSVIAGVLLIFLIFVMLAAERKRELGIARAVGAQRSHIVRLFTFEGAMYALMAAAVGSALGIAVGFVMVGIIARALGSIDIDIVFAFRWQSLVVSYTLGMAVTFLVVSFSAGRVSALNIVRAVRDLPEPPGHKVEIRERFREIGVEYKRSFRMLKGLRPLLAVRELLFGTAGAWFRLYGSLLRSGYLLIVFGLLALQAGIVGEQAGPFFIGLSLIVIGVPLALLHAIRIPERLAYTLAGALVVIVWLLPGSFYDALGFSNLQAGIEMFILSGVMLVIGAVWVVIYNSEYLVAAGNFLMGRGRTLRPIMRAAMAYPMATKFRTGMTLAMFSLVVFTLIVMSIIIEAFGATFNDTRAFSGGFDVTASVSPANPVEDLPTKIRSTPGIEPENVEAIGGQSGLPIKIEEVGYETDDPVNGFIFAVDEGYTDAVTYEFALRDSRYSTDAEVWNALQTEPDTVVLSSFVVPAQTDFNVAIGGDTFRIQGFMRDDASLPEAYISVYDRSEQRSLRLRIIGVLDQNVALLGSIVTSYDTLKQLQPVPLLNYSIRLVDPSKDVEVARVLESSFVANGMQAESLRELVEEQLSINLALNRLILGFMSLGLVVGVAALGVIAARSVVERRSLIGMLRAIGFQRGMVQLAFLLESSFIALLGIAIGMALAFGLSFQIINEISKNIDGVEYRVPWVTALIVFGVAYGASLLTTFLPAKQASDIYPAEALRTGE